MTPYPRLEEVWIWPDSVERWFRSRAEGYTLHVCCGASDIGDVTVDADRDRHPDVQADAKQLPFPEATFDSAIIDPPWKVNVFDRHEWVWPTIEAVKPDGVVLTNTTWIPESRQTTIEEAAVRQDGSKNGISLLCKLRRYPGQQTLD